MKRRNSSRFAGLSAQSYRVRPTVLRSSLVLLCLLILGAGITLLPKRIPSVGAASLAQERKVSGDGLWQEIDGTPLLAKQAEHETTPTSYRAIRLSQDVL